MEVEKYRRFSILLICIISDVGRDRKRIYDKKNVLVSFFDRRIFFIFKVSTQIRLMGMGELVDNANLLILKIVMLSKFQKLVFNFFLLKSHSGNQIY